MNRPIDAEKVVKEMIKDGLIPDVVTYTTLIDAYKRTKDVDKCWEIFEEAMHFKL